MDFELFQFETGIKLVPARLKEAREAQCLTMTELAELVGVTASAISAFEADIKQPEWNTLMRISEKLKQPISFFTTARPDGGEPTATAFFRSFKSRRKICNKMLRRWSVWAAQLSRYIGTMVNLPPVAIPEVEYKLEHSDEEIEIIATHCRRLWGLADGPIANMVALLENKGFIVVRSEFGVSDIDAFSCWQDNRPYIFLVSDKNCSVRSRFDAAHELGHMILHRHLSQDQVEDSEILNRIEHEANRFASAFLLPAATFVSEIYSSNLGQFVNLKSRWKTAMAAMIYRCKDLGVFDERQYVNLRKQMSFQGFLKHEPLDESIPIEQPQIISQCVKLVVASSIKQASDFILEMHLSAKALAILAGCPESVFADDATMPEIYPLVLKQ